MWGSTRAARMPKLGEMAQLSRPFQVVLLALAVLVLAWFAVLHRPGGGSASSSSPASSSAAGSSSSGGASSAAGPSHVYHGPAPGVEGLTRDIKRAHQAAAESERGVREPQVESAGGSSSSAPQSATRAHAGASASAAVSGGSRHQTRAAARAASPSASRSTAVPAPRTPRAQSGSAAAAPSSSTPPMQATVAAELKQGKVVLLLFWNPGSYDDAAVEKQAQAAARELGRRVALHTAGATQVNTFGSITRNIQVYQTPTLLIVNPKLQVATLTGYTDAYSIEQAVAEARG
jgi:hypothetical protein